MKVLKILHRTIEPRTKSQEPRARFSIHGTKYSLLFTNKVSFEFFLKSPVWGIRGSLQAFIIIILNCFFAVNAKGQDNRSETDCISQLKKSFITDGQDHQITIHNSKFSQLHVIFYPQFMYRVVICGKDITAPIEFNLTSEQGEVIFDNANTNYKREWDFKFSSLMKGIINIKLVSNDIKDQTIKIIIAYKITDEK